MAVVVLHLGSLVEIGGSVTTLMLYGVLPSTWKSIVFKLNYMSDTIPVAGIATAHEALCISSYPLVQVLMSPLSSYKHTPTLAVLILLGFPAGCHWLLWPATLPCAIYPVLYTLSSQ